LLTIRGRSCDILAFNGQVSLWLLKWLRNVKTLYDEKVPNVNQGLCGTSADGKAGRLASKAQSSGQEIQADGV
jgi:hypothetical protein